MESASMQSPRKLPPLPMTEEEREQLTEIAQSRTAGFDRVRRARSLLAYSGGEALASIERTVGISYGALSKCIKKALTGGVAMALADKPRSGRRRTIDEAARAWVVSLACTKPKELGYAAELWTFSALAQHIRTHCQEVGHGALQRISKGTVCKIVHAHALKPHKVSYYLEQRDPEFERKMAEVLLVYKEVELLKAGADLPEAPHVTLSCDEKPGIQAIATTAPDLPPVPGCYASLARDYEYKRHGTVSLLAGLDLHSGHVFAVVRDRHRSREFIELLTAIHAHYPAHWVIRLLLDNHSAHLSKETQAWLATHPNRFEFVFTPTHGSWLNIVETLFSKMTRSFLRGLRVASKAELVARIEQWIGEINTNPIVPRWTFQPDAAQ
jgi:transposase